MTTARVQAATSEPPVLAIRDRVGKSPCTGGIQCLERRKQFQSSMLGRYVGAGSISPDQVVAAVMAIEGRPAEVLVARTNKSSRYAARKAARLGYVTREMRAVEHLDAIVEINHSLDERCGKPMTGAYRRSLEELESEAATSIRFAEPDCDRHWDRWRGVFSSEDMLVGYARLRRHDDYMLYAQWLGHGEHLQQGVMHLLHHDILEWVTGGDPAVDDLRLVVYAAWDSGGEGLRYWKRASGFEPAWLVLETEEPKA